MDPHRIARGLRGVMEGLLLLLVCLSPWAFGAVHAYFELILYAGLALLLVLWAAPMIWEGRLSWQPCPVALCLAALFLLGLLQLAPLSPRLLAAVAPSTANLYEQMLPATPEVLPGETDHPSTDPPAGRTLSLNPGATRANAVRLLAVFLLFAVVRNNLVGVERLRRLSLAVTANGALLALFAVAQFFSSPRDSLYWTFRSESQVFGPFLCRNHFPFYLNLCIGLGLGLLLAAVPARRSTLSDWLHQPRVLWLGVALALMISSEVFSLSRGGVVALFGSGAVCLLISWTSRERSRGMTAQWQLGLAIGLLTLGLLAWFGLDAVQARLGTLWTGKALQEGRLSKWESVWPLARAFPWTGTGLGTFQDVEPLVRPAGEDPAELWEHAHNDYVEALVEGGWPRLGLSLLAIGLVYLLGWHAYRQRRGGPDAGLVLGALFAFSSVVIHSFLDFGLHVPAIALLTAVVAAHLAALGQSAESESTPGNSWGARILALAGAAAVILLGFVLVAQGWRLERAERLRLAASRLAPADDPRLAYLQAAVARTPEDAALQLDLAEEYFARWERQPEAEPQYLVEALRHWLLARDLCPVLGQPHLRLATFAGRLARADDRLAYLDRAKRARPFDPETWYTAGLGELAAGQPEKAWASWQHSLSCADMHLTDIVKQGDARLSPAELAVKVLPDQPRLLLAAARQLDAAGRPSRPLLEKAAAALRTLPAPVAAEDLHLRAQVNARLDNRDEAAADYRAALRLAPAQWTWRCEYAELLRQQGRLLEARDELRTVLLQQPDYAPAREAWQQLTRPAPAAP